MTVTEALELIRRVGVVENSGSKLRLKFPEIERAALQPAIATLRSGKVEALALLAEQLNEQRATATITPAQTDVDRAFRTLNAAGVRLMRLEGVATVGVWSDVDGPEVRAALRTFGSDRLPVRYLDGAGIPMRYKLRWAEGEPVPGGMARQRHD